MDDGIGVITRWISGLPDDLRIEIELRQIHWAQTDKFLGLLATAFELDSAGEKLEELREIYRIEVLYQHVVYRILGAHIDAREFVMLMPDMDREQRSGIRGEVIEEAMRRLEVVRKNPNRRRDYEI